jgi:transcriptional regulator with XRE-family HTH domain
MTRQATARRLPTTDRLAARRFELMAAEYVQRMGQRLKARRLELGLSQGQVARRLPGTVDANQVSRWERGIHRPEDETLDQLAAILEKPVAYFMIAEPDKAETPDPFQSPSEPTLARMEQQLTEHAARVEDLIAAQNALIATQNGLLARQSTILESIEKATAREEVAAQRLDALTETAKSVDRAARETLERLQAAAPPQVPEVQKT